MDEDETDWKIIAIDITDSKANEINNIEDVERVMPGLLDATKIRFKKYQTLSGKPPNDIAFDGEPLDQQFAYKVKVTDVS